VGARSWDDLHAGESAAIKHPKVNKNVGTTRAARPLFGRDIFKVMKIDSKSSQNGCGGDAIVSSLPGPSSQLQDWVQVPRYRRLSVRDTQKLLKFS
jgi:hypothetical protein